MVWFYKERKKKFYFQRILKFLKNREDLGITVFPKKKDIFNAFYYTKFSNLKVVIIGQDPYFRSNQAHGLSFSVPFGVEIPPSLKNIFKELQRDFCDFKYPNHGCLVSWAKQGVLLLNTILTVEKDRPLSHSKIGWEIFTNRVISEINQNSQGVVFLLWGFYAQKKIQLINQKKHFVLKSSHPSFFSAFKGFFGCSHFSITNKIIIKLGKKPINWNSVSIYY